MSFCFTSTFHLQSPSAPNGVAAKKKNCTVLGFRNNHTLYYHKDSSLSTSSDFRLQSEERVYPRPLKFQTETPKVFLTYFHFPARRFFVVYIFCFVFLHLMFITHGLIVVDSNSTRVYSCVQSLVMVSYA